MKRLLILVPLAGAAIWVSVALATPGNGTKSAVMSIGTLNGDVAFNTGLPVTANGLTWATKHYNVDKLPEFLLARRAEGVTSSATGSTCIRRFRRPSAWCRSACFTRPRSLPRR